MATWPVRWIAMRAPLQCSRVNAVRQDVSLGPAVVGCNYRPGGTEPRYRQAISTQGGPVDAKSHRLSVLFQCDNYAP